MSACRVCGVAECDNNCEELAALYNEPEDTEPLDYFEGEQG